MAIFTIIGSIIGAGFASGQEIFLFFYKYGLNGIYGLIVCSLLMFYIIYKVLKIVYEKNINTYREFLDFIFNKRYSKRKYLNISYINENIVNIFLLGTFFIMIAGFGAFFSQEFGINKIIGSCMIALFSYFVFLTNIKGLTKVNSMIVPILIICIVLIGTKSIHNTNIFRVISNKSTNDFLWIINAIVYTSYNIILLIPILVNLREYIRNKKNIFFISAISSMVFFMLAISIFSILSNLESSFEGIEMPTIYVVKNKFSNFGALYGLIILISIFTTATSVGISFLGNICNKKENYINIAKIMCISSLVFSKMGFSNLVKILFPAFGLLGMFQLWKIIKVKNNF